MKTVLITGAGPTGISGKAIKEFLQESYDILSPCSKELDLTDEDAVRLFFETHKIDFVVHCATYRSKISQTTHLVDEEFESNLRMYFNLAAQSERVKKIVYLGSGAEYDKTRPIVNISEDQFGVHIPKDKYGFGKYIMNNHCRSSKNIYNLRMFGTLNPYERYTKNVVCNICAKSVLGLPLTLKRDVKFSWVDIRDVVKAVKFLLEHDVSRHDYNIALPTPYKLSEIADIVKRISGLKESYRFEQDGLNFEYTCNTNLFQRDFPLSFIRMTESINDIYSRLFSMRDSIVLEDIDSRWNIK